jgi:N-acetylmuramoyl-L-alanine amidase
MKTLLKIILSYLICMNAVHSFTIVIDPGHGGDDTGAKRKYGKKIIKEKDLALEISKRIYNLLKGKRYNVYLTRSFDKTISLKKRAEIADTVKADLYISVHIDAANSKTARGFETFYLDNHNDVAIKKIEEAENKDLNGEALVIDQILTDLLISKTVDDSKKLAASINLNINRAMKKKYKMLNRGIKPGLFYVLALAKRPGVLLEAGFLSNPSELKKIISNNYQKSYAAAVVNGIDSYVKQRLKIDKNKASLF